MKKYIAVKIVEATTMTANNAGIHLGRQIDVGSAVVDRDGDCRGYLVRYSDGYESWCPEQQFDEANRPCDAMTFGLAIEAAKKGLKIARKGWNGKGIFVYIPTNVGEMTKPYLAIDTTGLQTDNEAAPKCVVPWLASQTDMLAEDWEIVT